MIKNLIFDLDNTLIRDGEGIELTYKESLRNCGYDEENYGKIFEVIDIYDGLISEEDMYYDKQGLLDLINEKLNTNYEMKLIDELNKTVGLSWTKEVMIPKEIIEKLSKKYNLYVYTNYFYDAQMPRIETIGYESYFKKMYAADQYGCKPFKKSMIKVLEDMNAKPEECIMIGDTKDKDIIAANNVGMKAILVDYNGKRDKKEVVANNYKVLTDYNKIFDLLDSIENEK